MVAGGQGPECPDHNPWRDANGDGVRLCELTKGRPTIVINAIENCPACKRLPSRLVTWYNDPESAPDTELVKRINSGDTAVVYIVGDMDPSELPALATSAAFHLS